MSVVFEQSVVIGAPPAKVFGFLHDPERRPEWDAMVDTARLEGVAGAPDARLHLHGRRTAPSWVGAYSVYEPPRRSVLRLVDGVGMPFSDFRQTITVERAAGGSSSVSLRLEYQPRGPVRILERFTLRPRLASAMRHSLQNLARRFP